MRLTKAKTAILIALMWQLMVAAVFAMPTAMLEQFHHTAESSHHSQAVSADIQHEAEDDCCHPSGSKHCSKHCSSPFLSADAIPLPASQGNQGRIASEGWSALTSTLTNINRPPITA